MRAAATDHGQMKSRQIRTQLTPLLRSQAISEIEFEASDQRSFAGQLVIITQWVQFIILIIDIEEAEGDLTEVAAKTITSIGIQLEDFIPWIIRIVTHIALARPIAVESPKKAGGMIIDDV